MSIMESRIWMRTKTVWGWIWQLQIANGNSPVQRSNANWGVRMAYWHRMILTWWKSRIGKKSCSLASDWRSEPLCGRNRCWLREPGSNERQSGLGWGWGSWFTSASCPRIFIGSYSPNTRVVNWEHALWRITFWNFTTSHLEMIQWLHWIQRSDDSEVCGRFRVLGTLHCPFFTWQML